MDQRSKYQSARNVIGRVLAKVRRTMNDLPMSARGPAAMLVTLEDKLLARFEPILTQRIESKQIRCHGDFHLGRALFTGKDFVILAVAPEAEIDGRGFDEKVRDARRRLDELET